MPIGWTADRMVGELTARIRRGVLGYRPGDKLPTYEEIGDEFGMSTPTAARVVRRLRRAGLVVGVPGKGTYVVGPDGQEPPPEDYLPEG